MTLRRVLVGLCLAALPLPVPAAIYWWHDAAGVLHLSNRPPPYHSLSRSSRIEMRHRARRLAPLIKASAQRYDVDPALLKAIIENESGYRPNAVSPKGAMGAMQLMPQTAQRYGVDPLVPSENIDGGTHYLHDLIDRFGSVRLAVAAYNAGAAAVERYGDRTPPFPETRRYVRNVMRAYERQRRTQSVQLLASH